MCKLLVDEVAAVLSDSFLLSIISGQLATPRDKQYGIGWFASAVCQCDITVLAVRRWVSLARRLKLLTLATPSTHADELCLNRFQFIYTSPRSFNDDHFGFHSVAFFRLLLRVISPMKKREYNKSGMAVISPPRLVGSPCFSFKMQQTGTKWIPKVSAFSPVNSGFDRTWGHSLLSFLTL